MMVSNKNMYSVTTENHILKQQSNLETVSLICSLHFFHESNSDREFDLLIGLIKNNAVAAV